MPLDWGSQAPSGLSWGKAKGSSATSGLSWGGKSKASESESLPVLEATAEAVGAPAPAQDSPGLFRRAIDLISRPNYAVAGAAEELFSPQGGGAGAALKRVGSELFSGIGDIKGQKEGFGQVMEQAGVGEWGSLSDIAPWLYSETGDEWTKFAKKGALDFTGRGTVGLGLDIVTDPLNLVNPAAIAARVTPNFVKNAARATIKSVPAFDTAINAVGAAFNRDWKIRNLPGAIRLKQAHLNRQNFATSELFGALEKSTVAAIPKSERAAFVDAIDQGTWAELYRDNPKMLKAAAEFAEFNKNFATTEIEHGLLKPEQLRESYAAHFYENSPEEINRVMSQWPKGNRYVDTTLGRHVENRAFDTLQEAEQWSKDANKIDPNIPVLRPLRDPLEILRRRGENSINAVEWQKYRDEITHIFGYKDMPFNPEDFWAITKEIPTPPGEATKIELALQKGGSVLDDFGRLSPAGKQEFVRASIAKAEAPEDVLKIIENYGVENAPKQTRLTTGRRLAEDGSPYVDFNFGKSKVEIPQSLASDLAETPERILASRSKELQPLLRWFDKSNNVFKSFVTVMFPAFHFRNAYSNVAQAFADVGVAYLNPFRHADAVASLRGAEGELVTKAGERIPYKQIQDEMARNGVTTTGRRIAEYTGQQGIDRLSTTAGKIKAAPRAFGGIVENEARAALYTVHRRRGLDAASAAEQVNKALFDYTNLSRVEQDFFRRAVPFYTWTRKNIERQAVNLATKPGLTAAEIKPFRGRDDENGMMASWDAEALKLRLNRDGKTLRVLSGIDLPIKGLDFLWNGTWSSTTRQQIGMLSPILKAPLEVGFGASAFTGKDMSTPTQSNSVGKIIESLGLAGPAQRWIGYDKTFDKAGRPKYTFDGERFYILFQSWALSRLVSTSDRQFKAFAESPEWSKIMLDTMTGLRDKEMNLDEEQAKRLAERKRQLEQSLIRWGQRKEFKRVYKERPR